MFKVDITNIQSGLVTHWSIFETLEEAQAWVSYHESMEKNSWGMLERVIPSSEATSEELAVALEVIPEIVDESPEMVRLPKTYLVDTRDITEEYQALVNREEKKRIGRVDRQKCEDALDLIAGYNRDRQLTFEQITQLQTTFSQADAALRANRPDFATTLIQAIEPDGVLVTDQMKQDVLSIII